MLIVCVSGTDGVVGPAFPCFSESFGPGDNCVIKQDSANKAPTALADFPTCKSINELNCKD